DGTDVALTDGNSITTGGNGMTASVVVSSGVATVTLSKGAGVSSAAMQTIVDAMTYRDTSQDPLAGDRVVTLTSIQDSGGTALGGADTTSLSVSATVTVVPVNDIPVVTHSGGTPTYTEMGAHRLLSSLITVSDVYSAK